ncbi:MAG: M24 family metallopeptidase [Patescibacteria group bacterium]
MSRLPYSERIQSLHSHIPDSNWRLISNPTDIYYYTGLDCTESPEREAWLFVNNTQTLLCHTPFLVPSANSYAVLASLRVHEVAKKLISLCDEKTHLTVALDTDNITVAEQEAFATLFTVTQLNRKFLWEQRQLKSKLEIQHLTSAAQITARVMEKTIKALRVGITEQDLLRSVLQFFLEEKATAAFPPVIAFGDHTALPHHRPSTTVLEKNMPVLLDIGAKYEMYCGDMTRTVWFGDTVDPEFVKIESIVKDAYSQAEQQAVAGSAISAVDRAARDLISAAGYGPYYIHTTGHGLGLEIHEPPSLYHTESGKLETNSTITIEPGIYVPGKFGYRYENTLLITTKQPKILTKTE